MINVLEMIKINFFLILLVFLSLTSCKSIKDGLSGNKGNNSDEFLVKKKNPLILPPDYSRLPDPKPNPKILNSTSSDEIKKLLSLDDKNDDLVIENSSSIEDFVLKNIKKN